MHESTTTTPSRRRGPRSAASTAAVRSALVDQLREGRLLSTFRRALVARGASGLEAFHVAYPSSGLLCWACFKDAAAALGYDLEPQAPLPGEEGLTEPYRRLSWRVGEAADPDDGLEPSDGGDHGARFYADRHRGLYRLAPGSGAPPGAEDVLWIWVVEHDDDGVEACLAARDRDAFRPLLGELHRREVAHDRRYAGLILVGNRAETRVDRPRARWEDLVLPDELGLELRRTVEEFFAAGPLYRRHELPHRRGILLAGPPGNGKTSILRAIGSTLGLPVVVATLEDPNGAHNTRRAFERAAALAPAVLCFEDLDALVGDGPGLSQFLNLLDGLAPREGLLVLATTNHPDAIDPAITKRPSRFDRVFVVPNPGLAQRRAFLEKLLGGAAPLGEADRLAEATGGYSMAFLEELVLQARLNAVRRGDQALTPADLEAALTATREHLRVADCGIEDRGPIGFSA